MNVRLLFMALDDSETESLGLREFYNFFEVRFPHKASRGSCATVSTW
jgi:hypothetical protein